MRALACTVLLGLVAAAPLRDIGEPLTPQERATLIADLEQSRDRFLKAVNSVSETQWTFKPTPEKWSIAEVAEHITATDGFIGGPLRGPLLSTPETPKNPEAAAIEEKVRTWLADRSVKAQAPEMLRPNGRWPTKAGLIATYRAQRDSLINYVRITPDALRNHQMPHPAFGPLDGYQWVLLAAAHGDRHVQQIEEVKTLAGYPK
jgi:hypothetical protein